MDFEVEHGVSALLRQAQGKQSREEAKLIFPPDIESAQSCAGVLLWPLPSVLGSVGSPPFSHVAAPAVILHYFLLIGMALVSRSGKFSGIWALVQ